MASENIINKLETAGLPIISDKSVVGFGDAGSK